MIDKDRVLVTGATGYIAGHCIVELLEHGYRVRGTVRSLADPKRTAHLRALAEQAGGTLELVEADLSSDRGWPTAVADCDRVLHVASPFPAGPPKHQDELVRPAVDGTKRVLTACAQAGVKRVVLTSSIAAIIAGHDPAGDQTVRTEADWSDVQASISAYQLSKTLAERAAWDLVAGLPDARRLELVVINPGFAVGPMLNADTNTSLEVVRKLLRREVPGSLRIGFAMVDVRDLAVAHRLAMERPQAPGNRYICAGDHLWMHELAKILADEFNPRGYRVPTRTLPDWLVRIIARFDRTVRLGLDFLGRPELVSADKARRELGWTMRPITESILDTANSMIDHGLVSPPRAAARVSHPQR